MGQDVELWVRELLAAGWVRIRMDTWQSPSGHFFRGPYGAWCQMHSHPELNIKLEAH